MGTEDEKLESREFNSEISDKKNLCHIYDFHGMTFKPHCWKIALEFQQALCILPDEEQPSECSGPTVFSRSSQLLKSNLIIRASDFLLSQEPQTLTFV